MDLRSGKKHQGQSATVSDDVWSTLPIDMLNVIADRLEHFRDRLNLASVCKRWRIPMTPRRLPWLAAFPDQKTFCRTSRSVSIDFELYEPRNHRPYKRSIMLPEIPLSGDHFFMEPRIRDSKSGWLLVSVTLYANMFQPICSHLFVYHPFSAAFMSLPDLYIEGCHAATFSGSDPTSVECVFFVIVGQNNPSGTLKIHTWSQGQEAWKNHEIIDDQCYWKFVTRVTWLDGIFHYCSRIRMGSFNPSNGESKDIALPFTYLYSGKSGNNLFVSNGEIFLLVYNTEDTENKHVFFKFDPFEGAWTRTYDFLNDRVLFISLHSPVCYTILAKGEAEEMGNRVYKLLRSKKIWYDYLDDAEVDKRPVLDPRPRQEWLEPVF